MSTSNPPLNDLKKGAGFHLTGPGSFHRKLSSFNLSSAGRNLSPANRKTIEEVVKKHSKSIRDYGGLSGEQIRRIKYDLEKKRLKDDLSREDLNDIREILEQLKRQ